MGIQSEIKAAMLLLAAQLMRGIVDGDPKALMKVQKDFDELARAMPADPPDNAFPPPKEMIF